MDSVLRLLAFALSLLASITAQAQTCVVYKYDYVKPDGTGATAQGSSVAMVCNAVANGMSGVNASGNAKSSLSVTGVSGLTCNVAVRSYASDGSGGWILSTQGPGSFSVTQDSTACTTNQSNSKCQLGVEHQDSYSAEGVSESDKNAMMAGSGGLYGCDLNGCEQKVSIGWAMSMPGYRTASGKTGWSVGGDKTTGTGKSCTPGSPTPSQTGPDTAQQNNNASGTCPGQVNGVTVYVKCTQTSSAGSRTNTTTDATGGTGSTTSTSITSCDAANTPSGQQNGSCTTTTTTTSTQPNGTTSTTTTTSSQDMTSFCKLSPLDPQCRGGNSSTFGGSCAAWSCDSQDAAQCAIATAVNASKCTMDDFLKGDDTLKGIGQTASNGGNPADHPWNSKLNLSVGSFDKTNPFGSTCPGDQEVGAGSIKVTIPLSKACTLFQLMGQLLVALTLLSSAKFVIGGSGNGVSA